MSPSTRITPGGRSVRNKGRGGVFGAPARIATRPFTFPSSHGLRELAVADLIAPELRGIDLVAEAWSGREHEDTRGRVLDERDHVVIDVPADAGLDVGRVLAV